jgi:transcriptional regulator with XRE-family HTH domain
MTESWARIQPYELGASEQLGMSRIGELVRLRRRASGLSQRALADRCGLNQSTICRLERGQLRTFRLRNLALVFGILEDPLLGAQPRLTRWS